MGILKKSSLPIAWSVSTISDINLVNPTVEKSIISDDMEVSFVPMAAVQAESGMVDISRIRKFSEVKKGYTPFCEGDILFAKITPCMENGKMAIIPALRNEIGFGSTEFHVLRPLSFVNTKFVYFFVSSKIFRSEAEQYMSGAVGQRRVTTPYLSLSEIPLPPLPEQHCIVEKIEELFSELDNGIESLKKAREQLKIYRQAVLKHAFEGKLTREWREQQIQTGNPPEPAEKLLAQITKEREIQYQKQVEAWQNACEKAKRDGSKKTVKPKKPKDLPPLTEKELAELPELPKGWIYLYLGYLGELARGKSKHRPRNDQKLFGGNYPFIQTGEVKAAHGIIKTFENTYNETGIAQSKLWPKGTLCITIAANIADTAFLGFEACFPDSIVGFTANKKLIVPKFVDYFIQSNRKKIEAFAPATAQKNINLTTLENLLIPYCELNEQQAIVSEIETRLSVCDQLEQTIEDSLKKAEALRQSILKKAFEGELTRTWREAHPELISGENSAESLLARIRAEKARLAGEEKKRRSGKAGKK